MKKILLTLFFAFAAISAQAQTYCTPSYSTGCAVNDDIDDVFIGSFQDTNTGCSTNNYMVSTGDTVDIARGGFTTVRFTSNYFSQYFAIWVDFNEDGDFDDAFEHLWSSSTNNWSSNVDSIMVPPMAALGTYRMRIRSNFSGIIQASESCSNFTYGEVHDYTARVVDAPGCALPYFGGIASTDSSVTLNWLSNDTSFVVEYGAAGFAPGLGTLAYTNDTTMTIQNLSSNTAYEFYVKTNCTGANNGYSSNIGPFYIKTLCVPAATPIFEGFENDSLGSFNNPNAPSCWFYTEDPSAAGYGYINGGATWSLTPKTGNQLYYLYNSFDTLREMLVSPSVLGLDSGTKKIEFYAGSTSSTGGEVVIGTMSDPNDASTFEVIDSISVTGGATWNKYTSYIYASAGYNMSDKHIAIASSSSNTFSAIYLDDITIDNGPQCLPPSAISVGSIGLDSAEIFFSATGIASWLEYGPNGSGKSTLLKLIMGLENPDKGKIITGDTVIFGHYTQDGIIDKNDLKVIEVVQEIGEYITLKKGQKLTASQLCERFLFDSHQQYSYVSTLSGGEKRRLFLLTILMKNPNFLILDEPTNDLDILTLQALEEFLEDFPGCLLVVSHDRYFLDKLCDHLFVFEGGGRIKDFNGRYYEWREDQKRIEAIKTAVPKEISVEKDKKKEKVKTKLSFNEKREWDELPGQIEALEARRDELNKVFEGTDQDPDGVLRAAAEIKEVLAALDEKEMRWLELSEFDYE